ncbi:hypothetical protein HZB88_04145 [archaeon]|nr:hypothetical protein [archaeon]
MKKQDLIEIILLIFIAGATIFAIYQLINYWLGHSLEAEELILSFLIVIIGLQIKNGIELGKHTEQINNLQRMVNAIGTDLKEHLKT